MAVKGRGPRKPRPPLDAESLRELALRYVGRFATSRSKLSVYLGRKVTERGWSGDRPADVAGLVERIAELGYVDDRGFALAKARSLTIRGYGGRRVGQALHAAGIADEDRDEADALVDERSVEAALRFARRKRIGPFADPPLDRPARDKALAAMVRAGHGFDLARQIVEAAPNPEAEPEDFVSPS